MFMLLMLRLDHMQTIWMNEIDEQKWLEVWNKYRTGYACKEFASAVASVSQALYLASCNFLSVIVDGSTNNSVKWKQLS